MTDGLIWVDVGYACFGLVVNGGVVVQSAPIAIWTIGKKINYVLGYYKKRKAKIEIIEKGVGNADK